MTGQNLEFKWGMKRGVGGKNKEAQFYASFSFDGLEYKLSDCVYMWKDDEPEPFVGKIIKMWQDKSRKVKILWFFKPCEIRNYLGDVQTNEKELFLASGEGAGLANVNPLEAIAGKCNVVCISKDDRNPQPAKEELEVADYVFYRTFDVGQLILSETIPEKIPIVDTKFIFNQREPSVSTRNGTEPLHLNEGYFDQKEKGGRVDPSKTSEDKINASQKGNTVRRSHLPHMDVGDEMNHRLFKKPKFEKDDNNHKIIIESGDLSSKKSCGDKESKMEKDASSVQIKGMSKFGKEYNGIEDALLPNVSNDLVCKPPKVETDASDVQIKGRSNFGKESNGIEEAVRPVKRKLDQNVQRDVSSKRPKASDHTFSKQSNISSEVTRKPNADRSRWFKALPWEEKMENAHRQGALVLLENLDPSYSTSDVEDIIRHGFQESCTAKIVYCTTNCSPSGQAFAVFETKEVAENVVTRLEHGCLMLSNGRPLIASFGNPYIHGKETLVGHFGINKLAIQFSREKKEVVSTSHCSQPNSIEYEFAMGWCLLHERYNYNRSLLQKQHMEELKKARAELKTKLT